MSLSLYIVVLNGALESPYLLLPYTYPTVYLASHITIILILLIIILITGGSKDLTMQAEQTSWLQDNGIAITDADDKYIWNTNVDANVSAIFTGRGQQGAGESCHDL